MKLPLIPTTTAFLLGLALQVHAENPDHIRQLLQTNRCENCDLSGANLTGMDLTEANLSGANLSDATLIRADFTRANLTNVNLSGVDLAGANFRGANLAGADLSEVIGNSYCREPFNDPESRECLSFALFFNLGSDLCDDAYGLTALNLEEVDAFLQGACNTEATSDSPFSSYEFFLARGGYFTGATLQGANLTGANLTGADLQGVDLRYATLRNADLADADLTYALLLEADVDQVANADFDQTFLSKTDIQDAVRTVIFEEREVARQAEAKNYIATLNRAQQAFYLEQNQFASNIEDLGLGLETETEHYVYTIRSQSDTSESSIQVAQAKVEGLRSVIGAVFVVPNTDLSSSDPLGAPTTIGIICETEVPSMTLPDLPEPPSFSTATLECPSGSRLVE